MKGKVALPASQLAQPVGARKQYVHRKRQFASWQPQILSRLARTHELAAQEAAPLRVLAQRLQVPLREGAAGTLRHL